MREHLVPVTSSVRKWYHAIALALVRAANGVLAVPAVCATRTGAQARLNCEEPSSLQVHQTARKSQVLPRIQAFLDDDRLPLRFMEAVAT